MSKVRKKYSAIFLDDLFDILRGVSKPLCDLFMRQPVAEPEFACLPLPS